MSSSVFERIGEAAKSAVRARPALHALMDLRRPERHWMVRGPMNDQPGRQAMVSDIIRAAGVRAIVETGTFRAVSTRWFAQFGLPVHTVEKNPRYYWYSKYRTIARRNVSVSRGDSRDFIRGLPSLPEPVLFYLDAHWEEELPLADEVRLIPTVATRWVAVVDDMRVDDDPGYGYDDYGAGQVLDLRYLLPAVPADSGVFWPALRSGDEGGHRRGAVVIASADLVARLEQVATLRPADR